MRRNEMILKIQLELACEVEEAEAILNVVEKLGMKPPRVSEEDVQAIISVYYGGYSYNQWDEELEKDTAVQAARERRRSRKIREIK